MRFLTRVLAVTIALTGINAPVAADSDAYQPTVLVTGSNRGIGLEFARQYAGLGWQVIATCRNPAKAGELQALASQYDNLTVKALDITDHEAVDTLAAALSDQPIDLLLNNAALLGDFNGQYFGQIDYELFAQVLAVNTIGTLKVSEAFVDNVRAGEMKKIVTLGSAAGSIAAIKAPGGHTDLYAYRASKAALHLLMRNLSLELADEGIVVGLINPGLVDTRGFADMVSGDKETPADFQQIVNLLKAGVLQLSTVEEAVSLMITRIDELDPEQSGQFINADGNPIPW